MDDGDPHVGVRLEAEGQDGDADEEHGDDPDALTQIFRYSVTIIYRAACHVTQEEETE